MQIAGAIARTEAIVPEAAASDQRDVLCAVFERSADALYRFILVRVRGRRDVADDLLQQTCCEAVRHRHPPRNEDECEAWLRGIARNLVRRHWRRSKRDGRAVSLEELDGAQRFVQDLESVPLPENALISDEASTRLLEAVTSLAAADQRLIFAYYFDGCPQAAIADELSVTEKSVESRLFRARGRLRAALQNMGR